MRNRKLYISDRREAAIHEAGHLVAAKFLGYTNAHALIWPTYEDGSNRRWIGQTTRFTWRGEGKGHLKVTAAMNRVIGVAGAVATYCWRRECSDAINDWLVWTFDAHMSPRDWETTGTEPNCPDRKFMNAVRRIHAQFNPVTGPLWTDLVRTARQLIVDSRPRIVTPDEEREYRHERDRLD